MGRVPCCSICMEVLKNFTDISAGPCGHTFHQLCLKGWMDKCESRHQPPACPHCMKRFECQFQRRNVECIVCLLAPKRNNISFSMTIYTYVYSTLVQLCRGPLWLGSCRPSDNPQKCCSCFVFCSAS